MYINDPWTAKPNLPIDLIQSSKDFPILGHLPSSFFLLLLLPFYPGTPKILCTPLISPYVTQAAVTVRYYRTASRLVRFEFAHVEDAQNIKYSNFNKKQVNDGFL
ncbi:jg7950 [Pararge aegeria aegeria]|uniref:Jg7950 protein n=1 Tax=Pararge aegeria aegeria TaxID=348720 RepID=A0A8S4SIK6_9NEOP|nr:jg7950 [Pararge aegeria aegeria]